METCVAKHSVEQSVSKHCVQHSVPSSKTTQEHARKLCNECAMEIHTCSAAIQNAKPLIYLLKVVPEGGIEPPTRGFSMQVAVD